MHTLIVVLACASALLFGFAAATHLAARARKLLTVKLKSEQEKSLGSGSKELTSLRAEVKKLKASNKGSGKGGGKGKGKGKESESGSDKKSEKLKKELQSSKDIHANAVKKLEEELIAAKAAGSGGDVKRLDAALTKAGKRLDEILAAFIGDQGQKAALLSDASGIVIAKAGNADTLDGVAAAANMLTSIPKQLNNLVPLDQNFNFRLDDGTNSIAGRAFESDGELLALTSVGERAPSENSIKRTLASLNSALE